MTKRARKLLKPWLTAKGIAGRNSWIYFIILISLILQLSVIPYGTEPIFDERHYVSAAEWIVQSRGHEVDLDPIMVDIFVGDENRLPNPQHPMLGKLLIATGIRIFGDNPWGWRILSVFFGIASIFLFYVICRRLAGDFAALLSTILIAFESLFFVHSNLAMLEVFFFTFMLLAFWFCLRNRYILTGVFIALSGLCKMTGLIGILIILLYWLLSKRKIQLKNTIVFLLAATAGFILIMPVTDFIASGEWINPITRIWHMALFYSRYTIEALSTPGLFHTPTDTLFYLSITNPWDWILTSRIEQYSSSLKYYGTISDTIRILLIPAMAYMAYDFFKNRSNASLFILLWFAGTYLVWIPVAIASDRPMYLYYFYPTVGAACMAIGLALSRIWTGTLKGRFARYQDLIRVPIILYLILHLILFVGLTPVSR